MELQLLSGLLAGAAAALGVVYTYWRGRTAGRAAQHDRFERFYEKLATMPEEDTVCFFDPVAVSALTNRQKALLLWYFTICAGAFLQMKHRHVDRASATNFMASLGRKFAPLPGLAALLSSEGFDADFIQAVGLRTKEAVA